MSINAERVLFYIPVRVKNTSRSFHPEPISLASFEENESICPVRNVIEYIKATALNRKSRNLFVSYRTFDSISIDTFADTLRQFFRPQVLIFKSFRLIQLDMPQTLRNLLRVSLSILY